MDFFTTLQPSIQITLIGAATLIIILILGLIFFIVKTKNIKSKLFELSIEIHNKKEELEISTHSNF